MSRILKFTVLGWLLVGTAVLAAPPSSNPIQSFTANPSTITAGFLGFSHEWGQAQLLMGDPSIGINPIYRQLLDKLTAYGGGPISIRVGGNTTDSTALPDASTVSPFAALFKDQRHDHKEGVFFYLGVNLGSDSVALATSQAQVSVQNMPKGSIRAIEIGNEPDFYPTVSHHRPSAFLLTLK